MPQAMKALSTGEIQINGYICPGHVSAIIGSIPYDFLARDFGIACVITGFEPLDVLKGIQMLARQVRTQSPDVEIQYSRVVKPEGNPKAWAVVTEVLAGPAADPARQRLEAGWGERVETGPIPAEILEWGLGPGESSVLAVMRKRPEAGAVAVLDDAEARSCAHALGVPVTGTLGLIVRAERLGRIASARAVIEAIAGAGFHIAPDLVEELLSKLGAKA